MSHQSPAHTHDTGRGEIRLLGTFQLVIDGRRVAAPPSTQRLIGYVSLNAPAHREMIAAALWPDRQECRAAHSLRNELWQAGRLCPGVLIPCGDFVDVADDIVVDLRALHQRNRALTLQPSDLALSDLLVVAAEAELLQGWYDDWVLQERERARQQQLHYLEDAARELLRRGKHAAALSAAHAAIKIEPLRESVHQLVIGIHLDEDNLVEARDHYRRTEHMLGVELGVRPSDSLQTLMRSALARLRHAPTALTMS